MRLHLVWIGKTRNRHCAALAADYMARLAKFAPCRMSELKDSASGDERRVIAAESAGLLAAVDRDDYVVLLDEAGREMASEELAAFIDARRQSGVKRLAFVIGGFAGTGNDVKRRADMHWSLTRLTLTHELARVVLVEQLYRAYTLLAGLPYHRGANPGG
ncbi:MAG: 23S rRNA (pseudouridine(1915)-N(3))-methyltransferase RlmH [Acidobacteria bacterium]|nr:23S rRNA (pseudouridine(1915)-N(3))-methyltransferase RlmH [Acidobacteriota bacterium]MCW5968962.1 23S rRNA (pseudouridine(1915)-N(3))-methyltransferase RlmH [Blastocatellales bacterium]